jgi:pyruvate kinase
MRRKTKIIGTLGPSVDSAGAIRDVIEAGLNVARLNFSHGTWEEHTRRFELVRNVADDLGEPVAIMQDVQGPKIRVGTFPGGGVTLETGSEVLLIAGEGEGTETEIPIAYLEGVGLSPGAEIMFADGLITLEAVDVDQGSVRARVERGGELRDHKGAAFPGSAISIPIVTSKDEADLEFGMSLGFDLIAASFVGSGHDIRTVKGIVGDTPVIAKIESAVGYANLDDILTKADGAMVARGDLGIELSLQSVPRAQSEILRKTNAAGKISITATEMLESMTTNRRPTRAEVTDVYRSVLEGTDAVMLSAETAIGEYPARAVEAMGIICREAEGSEDYGRAADVSNLASQARFASATAQASVDTADRLGLKTIVAFTETGSTARLLSKYRPHSDVFAFTPSESTYRLMAIYGTITPLLYSGFESTDEMIAFAEEFLLTEGLAVPGEGIVMIAGAPPNLRASTNLMKLHEVGSVASGLPGGRRRPESAD